MKIKYFLLAGLLLGIVSYTDISCSKASKTPIVANMVTIQSSMFDPGIITVVKGSAITWKNNDGFSHTATSNTGVSPAFDTGMIAAGTTSSPITFNIVGTFPYHCMVHGLAMSGTVIVTN